MTTDEHLNTYVFQVSRLYLVMYRAVRSTVDPKYKVIQGMVALDGCEWINNLHVADFFILCSSKHLWSMFWYLVVLRVKLLSEVLEYLGIGYLGSMLTK